MKYNLGCGDDIRNGWVNVDIDPNSFADITYDLEDTPWPWKTRSAEWILMDNVFEHLAPPTRTDVLNECHRILDRDGTLEMALPVPEVGSGWDVTHYNVPSWRWPLHPSWSHMWKLVNIDTSKVGPGRVLPDSLARQLTRFHIARCVDEVRILVMPR